MSGMQLNMNVSQRMEQTMRLAPRMIQSMEILQLPIMALEERIRQELDENPALELEDCVVCPVCGRRTGGEPCAT